MKFTEWLFGKRCDHVWETSQQFDMSLKSNGAIIGKIYILKCKHCGDLKEQRFTL